MSYPKSGSLFTTSGFPLSVFKRPTKIQACKAFINDVSAQYVHDANIINYGHFSMDVYPAGSADIVGIWFTDHKNAFHSFVESYPECLDDIQITPAGVFTKSRKVALLLLAMCLHFEGDAALQNLC